MLDHETFPAFADDRMAEQLLARAQIEQSVGNAAIAQIDFRGFDKALGCRLKKCVLQCALGIENCSKKSILLS